MGKTTRWAYRRLGYSLPDKKQTASWLQPHQLITHPPHSLSLPAVYDLATPTKLYFASQETRSEPVSVWRLDKSVATIRQLPYGSIRAQKNILCTDIDTDDFYRNIFRLKKREIRQVRTALAPWSHYLDGVVWGGYFDFVMLVAGKLCRMKDVLPPDEFAQAVVSYPLFDTAYERDYLTLLGIDPERVIDSRITQVRAERYVLANTGHWFYPNLADITALRRHMLVQLPTAGGPRNRVYISRAGRRRVINETEVIGLLDRYDVQLIEDKPRSVAEQVAIYQHADFIIGPHGASFVNILWCQPGTHLMELFAPTYFPDFYRNMAVSLNMTYSAYFHGPAGTGDWASGLEDDIYVAIEELEQCLKKVLGTR